MIHYHISCFVFSELLKALNKSNLLNNRLQKKSKTKREKTNKGHIRNLGPNSTFLERIRSQFGGEGWYRDAPSSLAGGIPFMLYGFQKQGFWTKI